MSEQITVPDAIRRLIAKFEEHREAYHSGRYNETQLRREFLDPFLKALGWDVDNEQGYAEAYKDVIHEDAIDVGGATRGQGSALLCEARYAGRRRGVRRQGSGGGVRGSGRGSITACWDSSKSDSHNKMISADTRVEEATA